MSLIPEKGLQFKVYLNRTDVLGVAEGNFPNIEITTSEVKGAGLAGSIDSPGVGQIGPMTVSLTWRSITKNITKLLNPNAHTIEMHADHQEFNSSLGIIEHTHIYVFMKGRTKNANLGNLVINDATGTQTEIEVYYLKVEINESEVVEIDKPNYIYKIHGVDYLAEVRENLGM